MTRLEPHVAALAFPQSEYETRLAALRSRMASAGVDLLLIDQFEHLVYYTGYLPTAAMYQCCLMPLDGEPTLIVRSLDGPMLGETTWVRQAVLFEDREDPVTVIAHTIVEQGYALRHIGVESDSHFLTKSRIDGLRHALPDARLVDFGGHMWELRLRKSPLEVEYLRRCSAICDQATLAGIAAAAEGVAEREVAAAITTEALRQGADNTRLVLMQSGPRSSTLHGALGHRTLAAGDLLHIEMVPHVRGYTARSMRPTSIGEPSAEQVKAAEQLVGWQDAQFAAMKPGAHAADIDRLMRQPVLDSGLAASYTNITGYTLGLVAIPRTSDFTRVFVPDSDWVLEAGMVFHMYTMAMGMAFSETIHVTPTGAERLTQLDRRLFVA